MKLHELIIITDNNENTYEYLKEQSLVHTVENFRCECNNKVRLEQGIIRHGVSGRFRCKKSSCNRSYSLFKNSVFKGCHIEINKCLKAIYYKALRLTYKEISDQLNVKRESLSYFFNKLLINIDLQNYNLEKGKLGGEGLYVEVDETHMITRRDCRGRISPGEKYWVIGIFCRESKELKLIVSKRRTAQILNNFILENVELRSIICSDEWKGYSQLNNLGFVHIVVKHKKEFINSENPEIHTQNIERRWRSLKIAIKSTINLNDLKKAVSRSLYEYNLGLKNSEERFHFYLEINKI